MNRKKSLTELNIHFRAGEELLPMMAFKDTPRDYDEIYRHWCHFIDFRKKHDIPEWDNEKSL